MWDKSISLGNILTMITMIILGTLSFGQLDKRVSVLEAAAVDRDKAMGAEINAQNVQRAEVRADLREIRQRLDALKDTISNSKKN